MQELGIVGSIFSDKTGTLTRNEMIFTKFVIDGGSWDIPGSGEGEGELRGPEGERMLAQLKEREDFSKFYAFFRALSVCHTVVRGTNGQYRAESPDELALVEGILGFNCHLLERGSTSMSVAICGDTADYEILAVNEFTSDRKRMSLLIRNEKTGEHLLVCKGADNIMMDRCKLSDVERARDEKGLYDLACLGLRTLVVAQKELTPAQANVWLQRHQAANNAVSRREQKLYDVAEEIEKNMALLGITAIEDKLQDEVPEVIADFIKAGVTVWMLTGDKEETAVNIGRSCNLIRNETTLHFLHKAESYESFTSRLREIHEIISKLPCSSSAKRRSSRVLEAASYKKLPPGQKDPNEVTLVIDGPSFRYFDEQNEEHRKMMILIGQSCRTVIACRLIPLQKQSLVALMKNEAKPRVITLAIGDGANDVSMIREGDVGVSSPRIALHH